MYKNKYLIKDMGSWMCDELIAFSNHAKFEVLFLRTQDDFYEKELNVLKNNGVKISTKPFSTDRFLRKIIVVFKFLIANISNFRFDYNFVIGIKTIYWFLRIDIKLFSEDSNIHAQFATQASLISLLIKRFYNNEPKFSFTFHAYDIYFDNKWFDILIKECEVGFSISEYNLSYIKKNYLKCDNAKLSRLGVFRDKIGPNNIYKSKDDETFKVGVLSWFIEKKGIIYLLKAMKELARNSANNVKLIIAGDGPLKEEYMDYIHKNKLEDCVTLIGKVNGEQKQIFFESIDLFVLPSISLKNDQDGIPVVLMEAIAYGLPIVSTNVSGIPEICINEYNGILIQEKVVDEIVDAIVELQNNSKKLETYSKNSILLSESYDIEINSFKKAK